MNPNGADTDETTGDSSNTRRGFLGTAAALGAVALAGCSAGSGGGSGEGGGMTATDTPMGSGSMTDAPTATPTETETPAMVNPDVPILNYALRLEHLENAFYREGLDEFADDELMGAEALAAFDEAVRMEVPDYLREVGAHEAAHVEAITATVEDLGGTPVEEGEYDFGYTNASEFLGVAKALENTGVAAYAGAAPKVTSTAVLQAAAGIHSVEARHAAFLNFLGSDSPFPAAVDEAKSMEEVLEIASGFITETGSGGTEGEVAEATPERKADDDTSDVEVLNYALTLEHLEHAFYRDALEEYGDVRIQNADVLGDFSTEMRRRVPDRLRAIRDHEAAHVEAITATVEDLGGTPVAEAEYDFGYTNASEFLGVAKALENTGVAAYKGAAPTVSNDAVFSAAIGIHSVEARHAAFLNEINRDVPFPAAVDEPKTMAEVTDIAGQFIVEN